MRAKTVSVIIRAKNEARWLGACLFAVTNQDYPGLEIVLVDNESTDDTLAIAKRFGCKMLTLPDGEFNYSKALNMGIASATGELVCILSGHCIPIHEQWVARLAMNMDNDRVVAVYGKQEPLPDSSPYDKRDLWITFGLDRKIQRRDYFFHNANSMIRRDIWERCPFNEHIQGVEDQDWAKKVLRDGGLIVYEPTAGVFHHHGIHHDRNSDRVNRVVRVIELIQQDLT